MTASGNFDCKQFRLNPLNIDTSLLPRTRIRYRLDVSNINKRTEYLLGKLRDLRDAVRKPRDGTLFIASFIIVFVSKRNVQISEITRRPCRVSHCVVRTHYFGYEIVFVTERIIHVRTIVSVSLALLHYYAFAYTNTRRVSFDCHFNRLRHRQPNRSFRGRFAVSAKNLIRP